MILYYLNNNNIIYFLNENKNEEDNLKTKLSKSVKSIKKATKELISPKSYYDVYKKIKKTDSKYEKIKEYLKYYLKTNAHIKLIRPFKLAKNLLTLEYFREISKLAEKAYKLEEKIKKCKDEKRKKEYQEKLKEIKKEIKEKEEKLRDILASLQTGSLIALII